MIDALILCGGLGTRLQEAVPDRPKGLAEVAGRPFLDILVAELQRQGLRRFVLCAGHRAEQIAALYRGRQDAEFVLSAEPSPLGTGGAVRHALAHARTDPFLVLNGDSHCEVDYAALRAFHARAGADLTVVVAPDPERGDAGRVALAGDGRVLSFDEKTATAHAYVNAGIYVMQRRAAERLPAGVAASLERELIPALVREERCFGFPVPGPLTDIGTPERYRAAQQALRDAAKR